MGEIINAIERFILKNPTIPTPADIENTINPPLPKIDWTLYIELKKKAGGGTTYLMPEEKKFMRNCEDLAILRQQGELENYQQAQILLANHSYFRIADENA